MNDSSLIVSCWPRDNGNKVSFSQFFGLALLCSAFYISSIMALSQTRAYISQYTTLHKSFVINQATCFRCSWTTPQPTYSAFADFRPNHRPHTSPECNTSRGQDQRRHNTATNVRVTPRARTRPPICFHRTTSARHRVNSSRMAYHSFLVTLQGTLTCPICRTDPFLLPLHLGLPRISQTLLHRLGLPKNQPS